MTTPRDARDGAQVTQEDTMNSRDEAVEQAVANAIAKARSESGRVSYPKNLPPKYIRDLVARFEEAVQEHDENGDTDTTEAVMRVRYTYLMEGLFAWGATLATPPAPDRTLAEMVDAYGLAAREFGEAHAAWRALLPDEPRQEAVTRLNRAQQQREETYLALLAYQPPAPASPEPIKAGTRVRSKGDPSRSGTVMISGPTSDDPVSILDDAMQNAFIKASPDELEIITTAPVSRAGAAEVTPEMIDEAHETFRSLSDSATERNAMAAALRAALAAAEGRA